jgi:hypothetical protein
VKGYNLYRNGSFVKQVTTTSTSDTGLTASTIYSYTVSAVDNAGNPSLQSSTASTSTPACTSTGGVCSWSWGMGGSTPNDSAYPNGVGTDTSGNVLFAGRYSGTVKFGATTLSSSTYTDDVFIAKYSSGGSYQWARGFGSTGSDVATGAAVDGSGNLLVAGYFQGTVDFGGGPVTSSASYSLFVAKYSPTGSLVWSKQVGGAFNNALVTVDGSGNVVVTGYYSGTVDFGGGALPSSGATDVFVAKYSSSGSLVWAKRYGGSSYDMAQAIAVDGNGNVVVIGYFKGTADFGSGSMTSSGGSNDVFLAKYASDGSPLWAKRFGATTSDYGFGVAVDGSGNVLVTGDFSSTVDFGGGPLTPSGGGDIFVAKYSSSGAYVWAEHFGGTSSFGSHANSVAVDGSGNVLLTGWINDYVDFGGGPLTAAAQSYDSFVVKFTSAGAYLWGKRAGAGFSDHGTSIVADSTGNVIAVGDFADQANFGCGALSSPGAQDGYVVKLTP